MTRYHNDLIWHHLANYPQAILQLAQWFQTEWHSINQAATLESRYSDLSSRIDPNRLPITMIATLNNEIVGTFSLDLDDLPLRPLLSPWLASIFVNPLYRRQGIGSLLVKKALEKAENLGISSLYLFTTNRADWYASMGFCVREMLIYGKEDIAVMQKNLLHKS